MNSNHAFRSIGGEVRYHLYDGHGSVRHLTDASGAVTDSYDYDAFGRELRHTGTTENKYRYAGEQYDADAGLCYLRARYYDPETGRFMTQDPYQGRPHEPVTLHRYLYANANPVMFTDPSGYFSLNEMSVTQLLAGSLATLSLFHNVTMQADPHPFVWGNGVTEWKGVMGLAGGGFSIAGFGMFFDLKAEAYVGNQMKTRNITVYTAFFGISVPYPISLAAYEVSFETPALYSLDLAPHVFKGPASFVSGSLTIGVPIYTYTSIVLGKALSIGGASFFLGDWGRGFDVGGDMLLGYSFHIAVWPSSF